MNNPLVADLEKFSYMSLLQIKRSYMSAPLVADIEDLTRVLLLLPI